MNWRRIIRHLLAPDWVARRAFPPAAQAAIEAAIKASEGQHDGELRFVAEAGLDLAALLRGQAPRQRAIEVFSHLRVWDTEHNSGVLIYVQLVDHKVEILADRGITAHVAQMQWDEICHGMEHRFRQGDFQAGALAAIGAITALLRRHFPASGANPNELPDKPVIL